MNNHLKRQSSGKTPDFVKPFLSALSQIHEGDAANRADYITHADRAFETLPGASYEDRKTAFAKGNIGLQADHTHYFDGFALMLPMQRGVAVAMARSSGSASRLVVDGSDGIETFALDSSGESHESDTVRLLRQVLKAASILKYDARHPLMTESD